MTIQNALKELDAVGLLVRERRGFSAPNHLYVKVPEAVKVSLDMAQRNLYVSPKENCTTEPKETLDMIQRNLYPNQLIINKLKENQTKGVSGELPPTPYGKYQNVFLSESEYAELKEEYPDSLFCPSDCSQWWFCLDCLTCACALREGWVRIQYRQRALFCFSE
jgi:hypothetical protein